MPTKYIIQAKSGGEVTGTLTRQSREAAFNAADTLLSAHGEDTEISISWEMCGSLDRVPRGLFE